MTASPIKVPHTDGYDVAEPNAASPAVGAIASNLAPPTVSPMAPSSSNSGNGMNNCTSTGKLSKSTTKTQTGMNGGRWTEQEHQSFLAGLRLYGREWKKVASKIKTRSSAQIRSHAQKYFAKLARDEEMRKNGMIGSQHGNNSTNSINSKSYGYYSDGGSSAINSGDDSADTDSSAAHHSSSTRMKKDPHQRAILPISSMGVHHFNTNMNDSVGKKRSRSPCGSQFPKFGSSSVGGSVQPPLKQQRMTSEASEINLLPSVDELLEKVSPSIRQRLSGLVDAEICALQVLSCYAMLQRQDPLQSLQSHNSGHALNNSVKYSSSPTFVRPSEHGRSHLLSQSSMGISGFSTDRFASTSSIY